MPAYEDIKFMQRCIDLAAGAEGNTYPNPLVGSVIVHQGRIIGEGFHVRAGEAHAERVALNSVTDRELPESSVLYTNLEPCVHHGRTPPCSDLIIERGIKRVVIGTADTSDRVGGRGITALRNAGCEVLTEVLEEKCRRVNRRFFSYHEKKRPYVILKWAQSADSFLDIERDAFSGRRPTWITGKPERVLVHRWRAAEQSVLAGAGTLRADNSLLNVREWAGNDPQKLILSSSGSLDKKSAVFDTGGRVTVFTHNPEAAREYPAVTVRLDPDSSSALQILNYLYDAGIQSLFIEGGAAVLNLFISENLWDEARIFYGRSIFGRGVAAPEIKGRIFSVTGFSASRLEIVLNEAEIPAAVSRRAD
jgi:diaminohydroxyphosphoribosylaminopyrimidine deaminase/5-amino-6-(5-phosphoribosylamino)uracil reductase